MCACINAFSRVRVCGRMLYKCVDTCVYLRMCVRPVVCTTAHKSLLTRHKAYIDNIF